MSSEKLAYRPDQVAEALGTSRDTVFRLLASGALRSFKIGAARFISAEALREFIREREEDAAHG